MTPSNLLLIMSDEHNRRIMGCAGHQMVRTPHMDGLAARGVRFTDAYCNSPICVPSRASFATGRHVHQIGFWDNAIPYDGSVPSWGHRLTAAGHVATSIGKLHFRSADDNNGFTEEIMPLHVVDGVGDLLGLIRDRLAAQKGRPAPRRGRWAGRLDPISVMMIASPRRRSPGCANAPRCGPASRGYCSSPWFARIFR